MSERYDDEPLRDDLKQQIQRTKLFAKQFPQPIHKATSGNMVFDIFTMHNEFDLRPNEITPEFIEFRLKFLQEELDETKLAFKKKDAGDFVDGLTDLLVVTFGTLDLVEVDVWQAWNEVHGKNMQKVKGHTKRDGSGGCDLIKPEGWTAPCHLNNTGNLEQVFALINPEKEEEQRRLHMIDVINKNPRESVNVLRDCMMSLNMSNYEKLHEDNLRLVVTTVIIELMDEFIKMDNYDSDRDGSYMLDLSCEELITYLAIACSDHVEQIEPERLLLECAYLQSMKAQDYQADASEVTQADYYPNGIRDILYMVYIKMTRIKSLLDKLDHGGVVNFEGIKDSLKDAINYLSFAHTWSLGKLEGQNPEKNIFNR